MRPCDITVVVPCYNVESFVGNCLDVLIRNGVQVIAVDDCSKDSTGKILSEYAERYSSVRFIQMLSNGGVSAARNAGVLATKTEWLMFCDPDDAFVDGFAEYLCGIEVVDEVDLIYFSHVPTHDQLEDVNFGFSHDIIEVFDFSNEEDAVRGFRPLFGWVWTWNACVRRSLFSNRTFNEQLWPSEDVLWGIESLCRCKKAIYSHAVLYRYLQRDGSCLHRVFFSRVTSEIRGVEMFYQEVKRFRFYKSVKKTVFSELFRRAFGRPMKIIVELNEADQRKAWKELFSVYARVFVWGDVAPWPYRLVLAATLLPRSRFVVLKLFPRYWKLVLRMAHVLSVILRKVKTNVAR